MIKRLLILTAIIFGICAFSEGQNPIPNPGFENWTSHTGLSPYDTPDNWATLNNFTGLLGQTTAKKVTPGNSGNWAIKLQGINIPNVFTFPGILSSGTINTTNFNATGGFPVNFKPLLFKGYYKYDLSAGSDTAIITVLETKWNTTTSSRDTVGLGLQTFTGNQTTWTSFTTIIFPLSSATPDTIAIVVLSGSFTSPNPGALYLDDFSFYPNSSGINEINNITNHFAIYPNPASENLNIRYDNFETDKANVIVSDVTGRTINSISINQQTTSLNTFDYANGMYFYRLADKDNQNLVNGKFLIINK